MPQFDILIYFTIFIMFLTYSYIIYSIISLFIIPFFWNIFYFRYLKKSYNKFFEYLFFNYTDECLTILLFLLKKNAILLNSSNVLLQKFGKKLVSFNIYLMKLANLVLKIK
jgi:hypothetical protein